MGKEQKIKDDDKITVALESSNAKDLLFFSDKAQVYKSRVSDFEDTKASLLGDYIPGKLQFDDNENALFMAVTSDYAGYMIFVFENGKIAKVDMAAYETKTNRKKLLAAYSDKAPLVAAVAITEDCEILIKSSSGRILLVHTGVVASKTTKNTIGVAAITLKKGQRVISAVQYSEEMLLKPHRHRARNLPAAGSLPAEEEAGDQLTL